ncbi:MAG: hypothetical protein NTU58_03520 [Candidatus Nealsonbacteria bacterium]|nr:hypothetical protein [Candidatus Nealsonbacteria bacterium]
MYVKNILDKIKEATYLGLLDWKPTSEAIGKPRGYSCEDKESGITLTISVIETEKDVSTLAFCIKKKNETLTLTSNPEIVPGYLITKRYWNGKIITNNIVSYNALSVLLWKIEDIKEKKKNPSKLHDEFVDMMIHAISVKQILEKRASQNL